MEGGVLVLSDVNVILDGKGLNVELVRDFIFWVLDCVCFISRILLIKCEVL